ncbi:MAG: response regulator [Kastovskya adunca ATA6-11-RM4]|jgi:CheY-like chemotaxis protein|nr:response regulator [Kastovskya adunca ATA6-11-RM4]
MTSQVVLLVEDNPDDEELTLLAFEESGLSPNFVVARDGVQALDYLFATDTLTSRRLNPLPTLVLLDLKLPRIDGIEVLRRIRADDRTKLLPVVILTTSSEQQDLINSYSTGCNSYIRKPVDFSQFQDAVRQLGLYWLQLNEVPPIARV